jgi:molybdopterin synthase sulfur carrier subunit
LHEYECKEDDEAMKITMKYFASLREVCGESTEVYEVPDGTTVGELRRKAVEAHSGLGDIVEMTLPVVNMEYVGDDRVLEEGDEVSFIPPVSGG